ncbi:peptidylprolyl isomerase [Spongiibacter sp. KMU-158]|uniref:Peptidyl-prolyl cis-trans isomerase n=1 Tax=Spongiibacter pelagi TaxID=2760804 RepID=A0A927C0Q7_9GAMM|nr:peptidylprolyl isomerase [Spongiibacter pelagi]MBD2858053.1 peptidylprolyl isomerase [Spongiibacter pelagi]
MEIAKNSVTSFFYSLQDEHGTELESNFGETATLYLHGANNIIPGLEKAMLGKTAGDEFEVTLPPAEAYGLRKENQQQRIPAKYLKHEGKIKAGQIVRFNTDQGTRTATVIKVGKFSVDVDSNHPLAGKTLTFKIKIDNVREATADEISHGHAHGEGGHQH